jgi:signal-transduction protein with cAMP-binding, CBS, and nucleotidyltransferase domain
MAVFSLSHIVDYHPLTVSSQAMLQEVVTQITLSDQDYALVMDSQKDREIPSGILTTKHALKLISQYPDSCQSAIADLLTPLSSSQVQVSISDLDKPQTVLSFFDQYQLQHLPVFDFDGGFVGIITEQKVMRSLFTDSGYSQSAETALQESEARLQDIIDNASAVIYLKDLQGR